MTNYPNPARDDAPEDKPIGGWASGQYIHNCRDCDRQFIGAKRAWQCRECAGASTASSAPTEATEGGYTLHGPVYAVGGYVFDARREMVLHVHDHALAGLLVDAMNAYRPDVISEAEAGTIPCPHAFVQRVHWCCEHCGAEMRSDAP